MHVTVTTLSIIDVPETALQRLGPRNPLNIASISAHSYQSLASQSGPTEVPKGSSSHMGVEPTRGMIFVKVPKRHLVFLVCVCGLLFILDFISLPFYLPQ